MTIASRIRLLVHDHTLFHHGAVLAVTDHAAMETVNAAVVHRTHAQAMVAKGEAEWIDPPETQADRTARHLEEHADMLARHASEHREMRERHEEEHRQAIGIAGLAAAITGI